MKRTTGQLYDSLPHTHAGGEVSGRRGDQLMANTTSGRREQERTKGLSSS